MTTFRLMEQLRIAECRQAAVDLLKRFRMQTPEAIDVDTIAWLKGKLTVKEGGIANAEGRLVATDDKGGVIRVARTNNLGRRRFTVAHEIGHFVLHQTSSIDRTTLRKDFTVWTRASEEAEANHFAAELLMPEFMFKPQCVGVPSVQLLDSLSSKFNVSLIATAFQYHAYTREPVALILSEGWDMKSFRPFRGDWPRIKFGEIHKHSAAGERLLGKSGDSGGMVRTPAYAWLEGFDRRNKDVMEDSIYLDHYDRTITLLWLNEPL